MRKIWGVESVFLSQNIHRFLSSKGEILQIQRFLARSHPVHSLFCPQKKGIGSWKMVLYPIIRIDALVLTDVPFLM
jgi:hypothetical protein